VPCHLVEDVVASCRLVRFHDGAVMLRPGQPNDAMAFVINGRLRVHLDAPDSPTYFVIAAGDCVGELSVIDGRPASAYVVADPGTRVLLVDADTLFERLLAIPAVSRNFMRILSDRVRRTSSRVVEQIRSELDLAHLQRDLGFAREIQAGMLPQESPLFPDREEVDCAARLLAARQVGGDFYDAFFIDSTRLFVTIGDVCGKGLPAALFMVRALTVLRGEATRRTGAKRAYVQRVVERVNRLLVERNEQSLFVSLFCALLDTATGTLAYVSAGHNPPALALGGGPFELVTAPRNPVAGMMEGLSFAGGEVQLPPESVLVLYTDGVTEAQGERGEQVEQVEQLEQFGPARLLATLNGAGERSATALVDATLAAVDRFTGERAPYDDMAVLALRYRSPAAP
jgi:serine phosphatase RsbU (regulator of sigma subunit)